MIQTFCDRHIEQAARMAVQTYQAEREILPILPDIDYFSQFCESYQKLAANGLGVAMTEEGSLQGYLLCYPPRESYYSGIRGVYCPLHGHGALYENRIRIYEKLYQAAAERWLAEGVLSHSITLYAKDQGLVSHFFESGFGMNGADAIRDTSAIPASCSLEAEYRMVPSSDAEKLLPLMLGLYEHIGRSPVFLPKGPAPSMEKVMASWQESSYIAAYLGENIISYFRIKAQGETFISSSDGMTNICGAYTLPEYRGSGVTTLLLSALMDMLRAEGISRCGVDCESYNPNAWHFWRKHFTPYTCSCVRSLNPKILQD